MRLDDFLINRLQPKIGFPPPSHLRLAVAICLVALISPAITPSVRTFAEDDASEVKPLTGIWRDQVFDATLPEPLKCDIYFPTDSSSQNRQANKSDHTPDAAPASLRPAVVLIHGGAWSSGSKSLMLVHAQQLAGAGIVAIAIDYRHAPKHIFPAQLDDVRSALVWLKEHEGELRIDLDRIGLFGYSAGGHLACLIASLVDEPFELQLKTSAWTADDPRWSKLPNISAVVAGGPPCDFRGLAPHDQTLAFFLGGTPAECPQRFKNASPTAHVSPGDCAVCFIHGENDAIVLASDSLAMFEAQQKQGVPSQYLSIAKQGHMLTFLHSQTRATMEQYFRDQFKLAP